MIEFLITLLILVVVVALVWWVLQQIPLPHPFGKIAQIVLVVVACIILIYMLLGLTYRVPSIPLR